MPEGFDHETEHESAGHRYPTIAETNVTTRRTGNGELGSTRPGDGDMTVTGR